MVPPPWPPWPPGAKSSAEKKPWPPPAASTPARDRRRGRRRWTAGPAGRRPGRRGRARCRCRRWTRRSAPTSPSLVPAPPPPPTTTAKRWPAWTRIVQLAADPAPPPPPPQFCSRPSDAPARWMAALLAPPPPPPPPTTRTVRCVTPCGTANVASAVNVRVSRLVGVRRVGGPDRQRGDARQRDRGDRGPAQASRGPAPSRGSGPWTPRALRKTAVQTVAMSVARTTAETAPDRDNAELPPYRPDGPRRRSPRWRAPPSPGHNRCSRWAISAAGATPLGDTLGRPRGTHGPRESRGERPGRRPAPPRPLTAPGCKGRFGHTDWVIRAHQGQYGAVRLDHVSYAVSASELVLDREPARLPARRDVPGRRGTPAVRNPQLRPAAGWRLLHRGRRPAGPPRDRLRAVRQGRPAPRRRRRRLAGLGRRRGGHRRVGDQARPSRRPGPPRPPRRLRPALEADRRPGPDGRPAAALLPAVGGRGTTSAPAPAARRPPASTAWRSAATATRSWPGSAATRSSTRWRT